jgi:hypothetical protein
MTDMEKELSYRLAKIGLLSMETDRDGLRRITPRYTWYKYMAEAELKNEGLSIIEIYGPDKDNFCVVYQRMLDLHKMFNEGT